MSNTSPDTQTKPAPWFIGMDTVAPFGVYLSGQLVGEYASEIEATTHYERLRTQESEARQKRFATLKARYALAGHTLHQSGPRDGPGPVSYMVERWGMVRYLPTLDDADKFLTQIGGAHE